MTSLADATAVRTEAQILQDLLAGLSAAGVNADGFGTYSAERALPAIDAASLALEGLIRADVVRGGYLTTAAQLSDPSWVRALAAGFYQVFWRPASKAVHSFRLTNLSGGGAYPFNPGDLVASTAGGLLFDVSEAGRTLLAGNGQTLDLQFTCRTPGAIGNIGAGQIVGFQKTNAPAVSIQNLAGSLVTAGRENETNAQLVDRCLNRWAAMSDGGPGMANGGLKAVVQKAAPTVTRIFIRDDNPFGPGSIGVSLANDSGSLTTEEYDAADAALQLAKPTGSGKLITSGAPPFFVYVTGVLHGSNANAPALAEAALVALARQFAGATLYLELVRSICMGARFDSLGIPGFTGIDNVTLDLPETDQAITPGSVLTFIFQLAQVP